VQVAPVLGKCDEMVSKSLNNDPQLTEAIIAPQKKKVAPKAAMAGRGVKKKRAVPVKRKVAKRKRKIAR